MNEIHTDLESGVVIAVIINMTLGGDLSFSRFHGDQDEVDLFNHMTKLLNTLGNYNPSRSPLYNLV